MALNETYTADVEEDEDIESTENETIRKLRELREELLIKTNGEVVIKDSPKNEPSPIEKIGKETLINNDGVAFFDGLPLIDVMNHIFFEDDTIWLFKSKREEQGNSEEGSYMDIDLLNIQFSLLNAVKRFMFDKVTTKIISPEPVKSISKRDPIKVSPAQGILETSKFCDPSPAPSSLALPAIEKIRSTLETITSPVGGKPVMTSSPISYRLPNPPALDATFTEELSDSSENNLSFVITTPKHIDTRTYTRPKKTRTPLDSSLSNCAINSMTITRRERDKKPPLVIRDLNKNANLNETFVQEEDSPNRTIDLDSDSKIHRNLLYVIQPAGDQNGQQNGQKEGLNSTFTCTEEVVSSPTDSNSSVHNISMEELHVMARLQEQSLKNASPSRTLTRKNTHVILTDFSNMGGTVARPPARTSSTDTYCVGQSNPESPGSSGLSSPLDYQSYDDITSEQFRRSMPNLAVKGRISLPPSNNGGLSLGPPMNSLRFKPYHISDTKLSQPSAVSSRLTALKAHTKFGDNKNKNAGVRDHSGKELRMNSNNITMNPNQGLGKLNTLPNSTYDRQSLISSSGLKNGTGIAQPRFSSIPTNSRLASIRPGGTGCSFLPPPGFIQSSLRLQTRIPAPGAVRGSRLGRPGSTAGATRSNPTLQKEPDWRDGCY